MNCPHRCVIREGERGFCGVRVNRGGELYTLVYGNPCAVHIDPIEKKPLFHFLPGTTALSIATAGCNLRCKYCQNYSISQARPEATRNYRLNPQDVIDNVKRYRDKYNVRSIAYTYTEPSIFIEYMLDTAKLAKKQGVKNVYHSNGYLNEKPLRDLTSLLDGANIDLKFFNNEDYRKISSGSLEPVLNTLKILRKESVWVEITYLIVPGINDGEKEIKNMVTWVVKNLGPDVPIHFSRFFPTYRLENLPETPLETVERARNIALDAGINYPFAGNVPRGHPGENTICPECGRIVIKRRGFYVVENNLNNGKCNNCGNAIAGVWR